MPCNGALTPVDNNPLVEFIESRNFLHPIEESAVGNSFHFLLVVAKHTIHSNHSGGCSFLPNERNDIIHILESVFALFCLIIDKRLAVFNVPFVWIADNGFSFYQLLLAVIFMTHKLNLLCDIKSRFAEQFANCKNCHGY